jgi:hypothetical protein
VTRTSGTGRYIFSAYVAKFARTPKSGRLRGKATVPATPIQLVAYFNFPGAKPGSDLQEILSQ